LLNSAGLPLAPQAVALMVEDDAIVPLPADELVEEDAA
jgi:hypothetical protein